MLTWQPTQDETHPINNSVHSIMYELTRVCLCVCVHVCVYIYGNMQISLYNTNTLYVSFDFVRSKRVFASAHFGLSVRFRNQFSICEINNSNIINSTTKFILSLSYSRYIDI